MDRYRFLAFDLGAESGRAVVGTLKGGRLVLQEIHRFANEPVRVCDTLHWDVLALYNNVLKAMRQYGGRFGESVDGTGIDTWSVDFGLLARDGALLQNPVHCRDGRTRGIAEQLRRRMSPEQLFQRTGLSPFPFSTLCQLLSLRLGQSPILDCAATLLMMPDLFAYFLTGEKHCERTTAVSTQLYDPRAGWWHEEIFKTFDLPLSVMPEPVNPGTVLGELRQTLQRETGLKRSAVIAPCTHDTASAVAAVPGKGEGWAFLSSGTWSVLGVLTGELVTSSEAFSVGGGSLNVLLCRFAADATGVPVVAGPAEATVAGNVLVQALARGYLSSPQEIRDVVRESSTLVEYEPHDTSRWEDRYAQYLRLLERTAD